MNHAMKLPFVLSIPHCSEAVPPELRPDLALTDREITESVDFGTREIFSTLNAHHVITAPWSRLTVDLNRNPDDHGEKGIVALRDYHGRRVFKNGKAPTDAQIAERVRRYALAYHEAVAEALKDTMVIGLIDCHSLNGLGPADAPDRGMPRKDITLSNNGDRQGRRRDDGSHLTCPDRTLQMAMAAFETQGFSVSLNHPYRGGHITNHYGALLRQQGRFALQIEMNQDLYMARDAIIPDPKRLKGIKQRVERALDQWAAGLTVRD